ncbi:MAG TPA: hypothetical protein VN895_03170 [Candidatus Acidoferrum sp.]|nr:hypothetical protein [Candidatus Acidoferrum sp.]
MVSPVRRAKYGVTAVAGVLALGVLFATMGLYGYQQVDPWRSQLGRWPIPISPTVPPAPIISSLPDPPRLGEPIALPGALTAINASGPVITPDQAGGIVRAWWPVHEQALAGNNMVATDQLESGGFQEFTDGQTLDLVGRQLKWRTDRQLVDLRLFVPRQDRYPADFLAIVETTPYATDQSHPPGTMVVEFLVFQRTGPSDSWKAALESDAYLAKWPLSVFPTATGGSPYETAPKGPFAVAPLDLPNALASYWTAAYQSGTPPLGSPFASATFVNLSGQAIYEDRLAWEKRTGLVGGVTYSADTADPLFQFSVNGSYDAVCFTVRMLSTTKKAGGGTLHQDTARQNYGGRLPPGRYQGLISYGERQTCVYVPPAGDGSPLVVEHVSGGNYRELPG